MEQIKSFLEGQYFKTSFYHILLLIFVIVYFFQFKIAFTGWDTNNKYAIRNAAGQQCFYAVEGNKLLFNAKPLPIKKNIYFFQRLKILIHV